MPLETYTPGSNAPQSVIRRYWTRVAYWDSAETFDAAHSSASEALAHARVASQELRADVDAMDGASVLATFRLGKQI